LAFASTILMINKDYY